MKSFQEKSKNLLSSTKSNWQERRAFIKELTAYIQKTSDPAMVPFLNKHYKHISIQFQDLR